MKSVIVIAILGCLVGPIHSIKPLTSTPCFSISSWNQAQTQPHQKLNLLNLQTHESYTPSILPLGPFPAHHFPQLITHSDPNLDESQSTFAQRYWFDTTYYQKGGPVFLLDGGETNGQDRLPYLQDGILSILSKATHGIGIILEHRYYGQSFPFKDLSNESLRYLNTRESLDDSAYFSQHIVLPGHEDLDITAPGTPWIYYGGSYAGAKAAFMMKLYPDLIWGSIASSAVIHAQVDFWQYYEPIRIHAPETCIEPLIIITRSIDRILLSNDSMAIMSLKDLFGLANVTDHRDFVNVLASPIGTWQERNWDPRISNHEFETYCDSLKRNPSPEPIKTFSTSLSLLQRFFEVEENFPLDSLLGYSNYIKNSISSKCEKLDQDECFGTGNLTAHQIDSLDQTWRSWMWQVCTEWGYFQNSSPGLQDSLVSKLITLEYNSRPCQLAFGSNIPKTPNTTQVNQYGDYDLDSNRLAFIDGSHDPWIYMTVHSPLLQNRTIRDGFVIDGGIHHWDENGNGDGEPEGIRNVHQREVGWVREWVRQFYDRRS
ncbi:extracellular serine carboxypeptidase [Melampsora larici-populina 98AG31]|uniref:Extracellular serine carboxypeptidase n=1 Tax=Melampsora larici-populina (strain 98AG31 / pathotype 3-4-7) TaxID=747676 RepID=F4RVR3_MELLP|nr:extracellular serine carboxypeptidase [Melampsora larici-populina 98AG31]EGG03405.1 extracellular serine carboxypeptidase [Melampsora larici-populina 98AG31]